jgi:hypothetical protein
MGSGEREQLVMADKARHRRGDEAVWAEDVAKRRGEHRIGSQGK